VARMRIGATGWAYFFVRGRAMSANLTLMPSPAPKPKGTPLVVGLALVLFLASIPIIAPRVNAWHWSRHPPVEEHRHELLEMVSKQFRCPLEELVVSPVGSIGASVVGCGGSTKLCWRQPAKGWPYAWLTCE